MLKSKLCLKWVFVIQISMFIQINCRCGRVKPLEIDVEVRKIDLKCCRYIVDLPFGLQWSKSSKLVKTEELNKLVKKYGNETNELAP